MRLKQTGIAARCLFPAVSLLCSLGHTPSLSCQPSPNAYDPELIVLATVETTRVDSYFLEIPGMEPLEQPITVAGLRIVSILRPNDPLQARVGDLLDAISWGAIKKNEDQQLAIQGLPAGKPNSLMIPGETILAEISTAHSNPPVEKLEGKLTLTSVYYIEGPIDPEHLDFAAIRVRDLDLRDLNQKLGEEPLRSADLFEPKRMGLEIKLTDFKGDSTCPPDSVLTHLVKRFDERAEKTND